MSAFADADRKIEELERRVEQLESLINSGRVVNDQFETIIRNGRVIGDQPRRTAYRPSEVGKLIGRSAAAVRNLINDGAIRAERVNGMWIVPAKAVDDFLAGRGVSA